MASFLSSPPGLMALLAMVLASAVVIAQAPPGLAAPPPWHVSGMAHYERGRLSLDRMQKAWQRGDVTATCHHLHQGMAAWHRVLSIGREAPLPPAQRLMLEHHRLLEERRLQPWRHRCQGIAVTTTPEPLICVQVERPRTFC